MRTLNNFNDLNFLSGCYVAGGCILSLATRTDINDYDVYPKSKDALIEIVETLLDDGCFVVNISDKAITFKTNNILNSKKERAIIQVMTYDSFETPQKIFENFDFTVCMGAYDCDTKEYTFDPNFYPDIASKSLRVNTKTKFPLNSLLRVNKYHSKGFFISKAELIKLSLAILEKGMPTSWEQIETEIGGTYGRELQLSHEGLEFNLENLISVLDTLSDADFSILEYDKADQYSEIDSDTLLAISKIKPLQYIKSKEGQIYSVFGDGVILGVVKTDYIDFNSEMFAEYKDRLYGYKSVLPTEEKDVFTPGIHINSTHVKYKVGEETQELTSPNLFVFMKKPSGWEHGRNKKIILVSFDPRDITYLSSDQLQVTKLKVEKVI